MYFCTPDIDYPTGGIRVTYRHADLLNEAGIPAYVLHARRGFRCTWFENRTRVLTSREAVIGPDDLVVVSEVGASVLRRLPPGFRFVVFNQNPFLTWTFREARPDSYLRSPDLAAIFTVSDHAREMLAYAAPGASVRRFHNSINPRLFYPGAPRRPRRIAYMPRRGREEAHQVLSLLRARGALEGWAVQTIDRLSERAVGEQLRSTAVFFSFTYQEGFGLPAAEAMACGAYVIGFHGFAGREFLLPEFSTPVEPGDVLGFAQEFERVQACEARVPGWCEERGRAAAGFIADHYSPSRERDEVVSTYSDVLGSPGRAIGPGIAPLSGERWKPGQTAIVRSA